MVRFGWSVVADQGGGQSSEERKLDVSRRPGYGNLALLSWLDFILYVEEAIEKVLPVWFQVAFPPAGM